jgi:diguanylate cyclase (GGDEF)-like protein
MLLRPGGETRFHVTLPAGDEGLASQILERVAAAYLDAGGEGPLPDTLTPLVREAPGAPVGTLDGLYCFQPLRRNETTWGILFVAGAEPPPLLLTSAAAVYAPLLLAMDHMATLAHVDSLTEVANRRRFTGVLRRQLEASAAYGAPASLIMLDLDNFKQINDRLGHVAGDEALQEFTRRICGVLRATDVVFRIGGDEFAVVLPNTGEDAAQTIMKRLQQQVSDRPCLLNGNPVSLHFSGGFAAVTKEQPIDSVTAWIDQADKALYRNKGGTS